jgi:peptidoglycan hydrolase-like protein with peptidoglycan-binding domain
MSGIDPAAGAWSGDVEGLAHLGDPVADGVPGLAAHDHAAAAASRPNIGISAEMGALGLRALVEGSLSETSEGARAAELRSALLSDRPGLAEVAAGETTLSPGDRSAAVRDVQLALAAAGFDLGAGGADGEYGAGVAEAVRSFQEKSGLDPSGVIDAPTLRALDFQAYAAETADGIPGASLLSPGLRGHDDIAQVASGKATLSRGADGEAVKALQRTLGLAGAATGVDGDFGPGTERAVQNFQRAWGVEPADGVVNRETLLQLDRVATRREIPWAPSAQALVAARDTRLADRITERLPELAPIYRKAEELTGVPASILAAVHANESWMGRAGDRALGPESGFGLDDRWVTTRWANGKLAEHGLGPWDRGSGSDEALLQSAVVAAEHLKRMGGSVGVEVDAGMHENEYAALGTAYTSGVNAARRAGRSGRSWAFDPRNTNPHPNHPGGTSRGPGGTTIRVGASRKTGLLRWDVLVPMIDRQLKAARS